MLELSALLLCALVLFMFGISVISLTVIAFIMILSFIVMTTLTFIFKFGFWILLAIILYYFLTDKKRGYK